MFGTKDCASDQEIEEVLEKVIGQVSAKERSALEAPLIVEEIHTTTKLLGKNEALGADEVLVEFFLEFWEEVGELILLTLQQGIMKKQFGRKFVDGLIVLLMKKGGPFFHHKQMVYFTIELALQNGD